jgi:hypothetical protein
MEFFEVKNKKCTQETSKLELMISTLPPGYSMNQRQKFGRYNTKGFMDHNGQDLCRSLTIPSIAELKILVHVKRFCHS